MTWTQGWKRRPNQLKEAFCPNDAWFNEKRKKGKHVRFLDDICTPKISGSFDRHQKPLSASWELEHPFLRSNSIASPSNLQEFSFSMTLPHWTGELLAVMDLSNLRKLCLPVNSVADLVKNGHLLAGLSCLTYFAPSDIPDKEEYIKELHHLGAGPPASRFNFASSQTSRWQITIAMNHQYWMQNIKAMTPL